MANVDPVLEFMPVGFRFRPTDEELVNHYLTNKLIGESFVDQIIREIDVCKHEPWELKAFSLIKSDDPEWFFFSPRDYKYSNSTRSNRATKHGFWKTTGRDRNIKVRGSNEIIGTKKTLVFYRGRVPNGVRDNWVIHEYHAVAFPAEQRTFVLCKLMKKPERAEGRTELIGDVGEPSFFMPSDGEIVASEDRIQDVPSNIMDSFFQPRQPAVEFDVSFFPSSPVVNGQEVPFQFSPRLHVRTVNDDSSGNFPFETTEEEDNFVNSFLVGAEEEVHLSHGTNASIHSLTPSAPLRKVYWESSDTDAEVVSALHGYIPDTSPKSNKNDDVSEIMLISEVNSSELSSNREAKQEQKGRSFQDDLDSSSGDSIPARTLRTNRMKHVSSASTSKALKTQYQPRSADSVSLRAGARKSQTHRKVSTKETYHEVQKETPVHSNNSKREAKVADKRNTSKSLSSESSGVNGRNSIIQLETPSSAQDLSPPSVYLGNVVIGLFLFIVIIWEMLSFGKF